MLSPVFFQVPSSHVLYGQLTGQGKDEGIVVDSLAQAVSRVQQLKPEQFPAAIWQIPNGQDIVSARAHTQVPRSAF